MVAMPGMNFPPQRSTSTKDRPQSKSLPFQRGFRDPAGARTQDPNIKSVVLYQLSYRIFQPFEGRWSLERERKSKDLPHIHQRPIISSR